MSKPTVVPTWDSTAVNITTPAAEQTVGWGVSQSPPAQVFNWFQYWAYKWISYLDNLVSENLTWVVRQAIVATDASPALQVTNNGPVGVKGVSTATTGNNYGVWGVSNTTTGVGVGCVGQGITFGIQGSSVEGTGVHGSGGTGTGVYGIGATVGVNGYSSGGNAIYGTTANIAQPAIKGVSPAYCGVYGECLPVSGGTGVSGKGTDLGVVGEGVIGVKGTGISVGVKGVIGTDPGGLVNAAIQGCTSSASTHAVYGKATGGFNGGYFSSTTTGIEGHGASGHGVYGAGTTSGVKGETSTSGGRGVWGINDSNTVNAIGVYGHGTYGYGGWFEGRDGLNAVGSTGGCGGVFSTTDSRCGAIMLMNQSRTTDANFPTPGMMCYDTGHFYCCKDIGVWTLIT